MTKCDSLFDLWTLYQAWVQTHQSEEQAKATLSRTKTALLRYTLPGWGFSVPRGDRLTKWEVEKGLDQMKRISLRGASSALEIQQRWFEQQHVSRTVQRTYRAALIKFIEWCEQQSWWSNIQYQDAEDYLNPRATQQFLLEQPLIKVQEESKSKAKSHTNRIQSHRDLYHGLFHRLINSLQESLNSRVFLDALLQDANSFFNTRNIKLAAVGGSCSKAVVNDVIIASTIVDVLQETLELEIGNDLPVYSPQPISSNRHASTSTQVHIPLAEFTNAYNHTRSEVPISDNERVRGSDVDLRAVELLKIYQAYEAALTSEFQDLKVIILDFSPSGILARRVPELSSIPILKKIGVSPKKAVAALAHPFHSRLEIPSTQERNQYKSLIAEFHSQTSNTINIDKFASQHNLTLADLSRAIDSLTEQDFQGLESPFAYEEIRQGDTWLTTDIDCASAWNDCVQLFDLSCRVTFGKRNRLPLGYPDFDGERRTLAQKVSSPYDICFLIAIGIRALIEACWERNILLVGVVKDSFSHSFSHNYLSVMKYLGRKGYVELSNIDIEQFFQTDRAFFEQVISTNESIQGSWTSVEFDSIYTNLCLRMNQNGEFDIDIVSGNLDFQERLFARSLMQFSFDDSLQLEPMLTVERLVYPEWDQTSLEKVTIETEALGNIRPLCYRTPMERNIGQELTAYLISKLSSSSPDIADFFRRV
ncbi:hypothetical protein ACQ4M3_41370 [Leptolyngbya sp. AN03gr2]|uniref:hypothetical protein n=1 Tax=unclassified Leptolyngbya TaxID=2650499 RepID=UPI003D3149D6